MLKSIPIVAPGIRKACLPLFLLLGLALSHQRARAQYIEEYSAFGGWLNAGLKVGVQGIGVEVNYPFLEKFNIRAGYNFFPSREVTFNGWRSQLNRKGLFGHLDYQPLYGRDNYLAQHWFVSLGAYYYGQQADHYIERRSARTGGYGYRAYFSRGAVYLGTGLSSINITDDLFVKIDLGYYVPVQEMVVSPINGATSEYAADMKDNWSSFPRSFLAYGNLSVGLFYTLPFGRPY